MIYDFAKSQGSECVMGGALRIERLIIELLNEACSVFFNHIGYKRPDEQQPI